MATYSPIEIPMSVAADSESIPMTVGVEIGSGGGAIINNQNKTIHPSASDQSIQADSGYTGIGTATVKKVVVKNLSASNVVSGVTVKIGDEDDDDSIASIAGTASTGGITPTGTKEIGITQNGTTTTDVTNYADAEITVAVPASAVDSGTKNITANGNGQDVVGYAAVNVNVPNSYSASDEGKVVSNGALVAQTAHADVTPTTSDQTIDTTTNDSIKVKGDADLIATNIKKDVEIFGVTGSYEGGGGGGEDGTFIATGSTGNVTISVSALYSHILVWDAGITQDDDISSAPYGTKKLILAYADNNTGFFSRGIINSNGTGFTGEFSGIGRWGGNTSWVNRAEFTSSTIKLISLTVGGGSVSWIDGRTINWRAW